MQIGCHALKQAVGRLPLLPPLRLPHEASSSFHPLPRAAPSHLGFSLAEQSITTAAGESPPSRFNRRRRMCLTIPWPRVSHEKEHGSRHSPKQLGATRFAATLLSASPVRSLLRFSLWLCLAQKNCAPIPSFVWSDRSAKSSPPWAVASLHRGYIGSVARLIVVAPLQMGFGHAV
jgi:hypothetical protein